MKFLYRLILVVPGLCLLLLLGALAGPAPLAAQNANERCFEETGYCIEGRMLEFWVQNNGLIVFGLPITPQQEETIEGQPRQVQWFERNRLELHPENPPPFDVQVSRLGPTHLEQRGLNWYDFPTNENPGLVCETFESGHSICGDMLSTWRSNGIEIDGVPGANRAESQALFGMPISDEMPMRLGDGQEYIVQYFERARFERHPENDFPFTILVGRLGVEVLRGEVCANAEPITRDSDRFWIIINEFERTWPQHLGSPGELLGIEYMRTYDDWVVFKGEFSEFQHTVVLLRPDGAGGHRVATAWHGPQIIPNEVRSTFVDQVPDVPAELLCFD
jgi:hypothetical protein